MTGVQKFYKKYQTATP